MAGPARASGSFPGTGQRLPRGAAHSARRGVAAAEPADCRLRVHRRGSGHPDPGHGGAGRLRGDRRDGGLSGTPRAGQPSVPDAPAGHVAGAGADAGSGSGFEPHCRSTAPSLSRARTGRRRGARTALSAGSLGGRAAGEVEEPEFRPGRHAPPQRAGRALRMGPRLRRRHQGDHRGSHPLRHAGQPGARVGRRDFRRAIRLRPHGPDRVFQALAPPAQGQSARFPDRGAASHQRVRLGFAPK